MTSGFGVAPWLRTVPAGDLAAVERGGAAGARAVRPGAGARAWSVVMKRGAMGSGFIARWRRAGIANRVVDSASIEVNRRARRTKTDRIDALKLVHDAGARVPRASAACGRGAGAECGGGSGAARQSGADGADAGADAAAESDAGVGWRRRVPRADARGADGVVDAGAGLGGRAVAGAGASADRAGAGPVGAAGGAARRDRARSKPRRRGGGRREARAPLGAAERGRDDQRVGAAR